MKSSYNNFTIYLKRYGIILILLAIIPTFLVWLPFVLKIEKFWGIPLKNSGMATIVANYDGPLYLVVSKTLYNISQIKDNFSFSLPVEYYAAHFPLFPLLIRILSFFFGYPYSMLIVTLSSSILAVYFFHNFIRSYVDEKNVFFLTFLFSIFPARWLIVRSVGSPEPLFLASIIASIHFFSQKKYWQAGIWGAIAQLTKPPGILIFVSFIIYLLIPFLVKTFSVHSLKNSLSALAEKSNIKMYPLFLIPISLFSVFVYYKFVFNDFFAYFHSGDNIHLIFPPFQIFNATEPWVGTFWLEEVVFVYLIGFFGLTKLLEEKNYLLFSFSAIFFLSIIFVSHRDLIRYALPMVPFLIVAYKDTLIKKGFKISLFFLIIPIYLFSLSYILGNVMPISDWAPFL